MAPHYKTEDTELSELPMQASSNRAACMLKKTYGSCWSAGSIRWAPSQWACIPWFSCSSPGLCSQWSRLCLYQTLWRLLV